MSIKKLSKRKNMCRKTLRRKNMRRKTLRRKNMRRKTMRRKNMRQMTGGSIPFWGNKDLRGVRMIHGWTPLKKGHPRWIKYNTVNECHSCTKKFNLFSRGHHCVSCGDLFCSKCLKNVKISTKLPEKIPSPSDPREDIPSPWGKLLEKNRVKVAQEQVWAFEPLGVYKLCELCIEASLDAFRSPRPEDAVEYGGIKAYNSDGQAINENGLLYNQKSHRSVKKI